MLRYIEFAMPTQPDVTIRMTEQLDGTVLVDVNLTNPTKGASLRGLFFDVRQSSVLPHMTAAGADVTSSQFSDGSVIDLGAGTTMRGNSHGKFDAGVGFGAPGKTAGFITQTQFTLGSTTSPVTLDDLAQVAMGVRVTGLSGPGSSAGPLVMPTMVTPAAPNAHDDSVSANEDVATTFHLLSNDTDEDAGDILVITGVTDPAHGSVTVAADGKSVIYTSDHNYSGDDTFTYDIYDGHGGHDTATVNVNVVAVADAPTLTVTQSAGANTNEIVFTLHAEVTDTDGSEYLDRFDFSSLPAGVTLSGQSGLTINPTTQGASLDATVTLVLPIGVDSDFDFTVTAVSKEKSNGDEAVSSDTTHAELDATHNAYTETFAIDDQSIWSSGDAFTFVDDRFLGVQGSFGDSFGGFVYGGATASIKTGFQSTLTFDGGSIDANLPVDISVDTNYNRTTDVLQIDMDYDLKDATFSTFGPSGSYVLDFIFNYALHAWAGIDFEVDSYSLFDWNNSNNFTINILDLSSEDIGYSYELPYGLSIDLAWPTVNTAGDYDALHQLASSGASNNFLQLTLDVDQALADIFLEGVNPFSYGFDITVAGGTAEIIDLDLFGGLNFIQDFILSMNSLTGTIEFEDGSTAAFNSSSMILDHASDYDADHNGVVDFELHLTPSVTLNNSTDLGFNIGYSFDLLKAAGWWDFGLDSGSWSAGPAYHAGGTLPLGSVEVFGSTFGVTTTGDADLLFSA